MVKRFLTPIVSVTRTPNVRLRRPKAEGGPNAKYHRSFFGYNLKILIQSRYAIGNKINLQTEICDKTDNSPYIAIFALVA